MGTFLVRQVDRVTGTELTRFAAPNFLALEGLPHLLHQVFPPYDAPLALQLGASGPTLFYPEGRPNPGGGVAFGPELTFADCTGPEANEGGGYTDAMRSSFGYARRAVSFTASREADGGAVASPEVEFPNEHEWLPQPTADWDQPWTPDEVEQPPPAWTPKQPWEPEVGFPWQRPRKRCGVTCDPLQPDDCLPAYMHEWEPNGDLDWLCDVRKLGGFPITLAFLADSSRDKLVAAAGFRAPVLLRPGTTLYVRYQARLFGPITADFALRFARLAFNAGGSRYDTIYCRPVLQSAPPITRRTTYADVAAHFPAALAAQPLASWTYNAGPPRQMTSDTVPQWTNSSGQAIGPLAGLAVYGEVGAASELMWVTPLTPPVTIAAGDTLRVPDGAQFVLESV
jgi:hypothetical protein